MMEHFIQMLNELQICCTECAGLPLGIVKMAGTMREVSDISEWRAVLAELEQPKVEPGDIMDIEVFQILKLSYNRLNAKLQQYLLSCALFPEDYKVSREQLIGYLIDEGIMGDADSRQAQFDEGHTMLNKLENGCLLEGLTGKDRDIGFMRIEWFTDMADNNRYVKMHDLIRDMALQIMEMSSKAMVKAGKGLRKLPNEEWITDLVRVSLMRDGIVEISSRHSPSCPNLKTLLLHQNYNLRSIADSFFKQLQSLEVLDLSATGIEKLPDAISDLVNLSALLLHNCGCLRYIPSLAKLRALKKLDLFKSKIEEVPEGMEFLCKLKHLNLCGTNIRMLPVGILPKLSQLQLLDVYSIPLSIMNIKGVQVGCLTKLEALGCWFDDLQAFNAYTQSLEECGGDNRQRLSNFTIFIGEVHYRHNYVGFSKSSKSVYLNCCDISRDGGIVVLPKGIQRLTIDSCIVAGSLCDFCPLETATELEELMIQWCDRMECLFSLEKLRVPFSRGGTIPPPIPPLPSDATFSQLKQLCFFDCLDIKTVFPPGLLSNFQKLEFISIEFCETLEEIVTRKEDEEEGGESSCIHFTLPKLTHLVLSGLPELKSICIGKLSCDSLQTIRVFNCEKLKRMPISLPLLGNGQPSSLGVIRIHPEEWWESVEWDHHDMDALLPYRKTWLGYIPQKRTGETVQ